MLFTRVYKAQNTCPQQTTTDPGRVRIPHIHGMRFIYIATVTKLHQICTFWSFILQRTPYSCDCRTVGSFPSRVIVLNIKIGGY